jgi:CheY-like chemotaxis protein
MIQTRTVPTILLVEGYAETREMLRGWLDKKGYRIVEAADGLEALDLAPLAHPDMILMDVRLPKLNGIAVARRLRQKEEFLEIPIVGLSVLDTDVIRRAAKSVGFVEYLTKPIDLQKLEAVLTQVLHLDARAANATTAPAGEF